MRGKAARGVKTDTSGREGSETPWSFLAGGGETGAIIRAFDWAKTPLGSPALWPQALKTLVQLLLASRQAMFLCWGEERTLLYNDAYAAMLADKHPAAMGGDFLSVWHEIRDELAPIVSKAYSGEPAHMDDITLYMERRGYREETHFSFSYTPVRDDTNRVAGFFCPCEEITDEVMEKRQAALRTEMIEELRGIDDPRQVSSTASKALGRHFGADAVCFAEIAADGGSFRIRRHFSAEGVPSLRGRHDLAVLGAPLFARLQTGDTVMAELAGRGRATAGIGGPFASFSGGGMLAAPVLEGDKIVFVLFVLSRSPHAFTAHEAALAAQKAERVWPFLKHARTDQVLREERAFLDTVIETAPVGISIARDPLGLPPILNQEARRMTGVNDLDGCEEVRYRRFAAVHQDGTRYAVEDYPTVRALRDGEEITAEPMIYDRDGERRRWLVHSRPIRDAGGEIIAAVSALVDVEEQRRTEEQVRLVARELKHRVGNLFAVVQSLVSLSARGEADAGALAETLRARIGALAAAHAVGMSDDVSASLAITDMVEAILRPYGKTGQYFKMDGPEVTLPPSAVTPVGLILHELATNAVKYGAWSQEDGRLSVGWHSTEDGGLVIDWQERCDRPQTCHEGRLGSGFGTRLMRGAAAQLKGRVEQYWEAQGLRTLVTVFPEDTA